MTSNANQLDLSRIEPLIPKENYIVGLIFPGKGFIPVRMTEKEAVNWKYTDIGTLEADEWVAAAKLAYATASVTNALEVESADELIQLFYGMEPSALKVYLNYPVDSARRRLPRISRSDRMNMGYVDGFESPLLQPSPKSEVWIPHEVDVGFAFHNPLAYSIATSLMLYAIRFRYKTIKDADLIHKILAGQKECRMVTLGGLESFQYTTFETFGMDAVPLTASRATIESIVRNAKKDGEA